MLFGFEFSSLFELKTGQEKMGSLGGEVSTKKKAMWLYPKVIGVSPSERWGHSACYSNGLVYIFGVRMISERILRYFLNSL